MTTPSDVLLLSAAVESRPYLRHVADRDDLWARVVAAIRSAQEYAALRVALTGLDIELYDEAARYDDPLHGREVLAGLRRARVRVQVRREALLEVAAGLRQAADPLPDSLPAPVPATPPRPRRVGGRGKRAPVSAAQIVEASDRGRVTRQDVAIELGISTATLGNILSREKVRSPWARAREGAGA